MDHLWSPTSGTPSLRSIGYRTLELFPLETLPATALLPFLSRSCFTADFPENLLCWNWPTTELKPFPPFFSRSCCRALQVRFATGPPSVRVLSFSAISAELSSPPWGSREEAVFFSSQDTLNGCHTRRLLVPALRDAVYLPPAVLLTGFFLPSRDEDFFASPFVFTTSRRSTIPPTVNDSSFSFFSCL